MKEIKLYECGICNTRYSSAEMAEKCEKSHKIPKKVIGVKWHPITVVADGTPEKISIEFQDGSKKIYKK